MTVQVQGPDQKTYQFPDGTDKAAAIGYFKKKGIGAAPPTQPEPNSILGGAFRRGVDVAKGIGSTFAPPKGAQEQIANFLLPAAGTPLLRMGKGAYESGKEGLGQAKQQFSEAGKITSDPISKFLTLMQSGLTAAGSINPLTSGTVTNINKLENQGRNREAIGQGGLDAALMLLGGKKGEAAAESVERAAKNPLAPARILAQEAGGAGKEPVLKAARERAEQAAKVGEKNSANSAKYVQKEFSARQGERASTAADSQRSTIARGQKEYARLASDNIRATQKAAKSALDARWKNISKQMEAPVKGANGEVNTSPVAGKPIRDSIEQAQTQYLVGSPEDLKAFKDLMGRLSDPSIESAEYTKPLGWNEARTHFTNINDRLYNGQLTPNVYQALKLVRNSLDEQLGIAAQSRGLGGEYSALKNDWSQYKGDFDDLSGMATGGGSPLARAIRFQSPADMETLLNGQYSDNILQRLSRYQNRGANPKLITSYRELGKRAEGIESPRVPAHPTRPPVQSLPPEIKPYEIRLRKLEELSGRPASIWDLYPVRAVERLMLKSPKMREWIASQPRKELQP